MDQNNQQTVHQLLEDDSHEFWRPSKVDNYDLTRKLLRTGCRPTQRQYLKCIRQESEENFNKCQILKEDLDKCLNLASFVYASRNDVE